MAFESDRPLGLGQLYSFIVGRVDPHEAVIGPCIFEEDQLIEDPDRRNDDGSRIVADVDDFLAFAISSAHDVKVRMIAEEVSFAFTCRTTHPYVDRLWDLLRPSGLPRECVQAIDVTSDGANKNIVAIDRWFEDSFWKFAFPNEASILCG